MWRTCEHVSRPCELVFALGLSLTSFHSVAMGFAILCFQRWILMNMNASMVAFIEIWGNCPRLFCMLTNTTLNRLGFGMLTVGNQPYFDWICWLVPVATDTCSSVFIRQILFGIGGKRSIRVCLNQGTANYVNTVCYIHQGKYSNQSHGVCLRGR